MSDIQTRSTAIRPDASATTEMPPDHLLTEPPHAGDDHLLPEPPHADEHHLLTAPPDQDPPNNDGDKKQEPPKPGNLRLIAIIAVLVFLVLLLLGIVPRLLRGPQLNRAAKEQKSDGTQVQYITPSKPPPFSSLMLPGNIQAVQQTAINARASGYVKQLLVDIGDKVQAGQTLAIISTPDVDQQLIQAQAQVTGSQAQLAQAQSGEVGQVGNLSQARANLSRAEAALAQANETLSQSRAQLAQSQQAAAQQAANLAQAQANLNLAKVTNQRYQNLVKVGAVDQQTADQQFATYQTSQANVDALSAALGASKANVDAFRAGVRSSQANVKAFADGIKAAQAAVATAQSDVLSSAAVVNASRANVASNRANVQRLHVLQGFNRVTAPFAGVITARNVDNGALINAGGNSGSSTSDTGSSIAGSSSSANAAGGSAIGGSSSSSSSSGGSPSAGSGSSSGSLFSLAQLGLLRIYVNVPQEYSGVVKEGVRAKISAAAVAGKTYIGAVTRTAGALDPSTRTLVCEVRVANTDGQLKPGMFAEISFHLPQAVGGGFLLPGNAIVTNAQGTQVAVVTPQNTVHFEPVAIGRDYGKVTQIKSGLQGNEKVIATPTDSMQEGEKVKAQPSPAPSASDGSAGAASGSSGGSGANPGGGGSKRGSSS